MSNLQTLKVELKKRALDFRSANGLGTIEPIYLKSLLIKLNVITMFRPLSEKLSGVAVKSDMNRFILINSSNQLGKQHFTLAHELYHLFVQENFSFQKCFTGLFIGQKDEEEKKADLFAAHLLMPEDGILKLIPDFELEKGKVSLSTVFKLQNYYSVSFSALVYRLKDLGYVSKDFADSMKGRIIRDSVNLGFGDQLFKSNTNAGLTIGNYGSLANDKLRTGLIGESKFFELMNAIGVDILSDNGSVDE